jgi:polysaccharide transporter, PST family
MNLIKTSFFSGIAVGFQVISAFVISKVVAIYIGPSGLALIGQFQNFSSIVQSFANGGITQGIVKYVAEYREDIEQKKKILSTAVVISLSCSVIIGILLFFFRHILALKLLKNVDFSDVFVIFSFTIILFALNILLLSVLNGQREIKKYVSINICTSVLNLLIVSLLIYFFGLHGAFIALVINQSVIFFVTLGLVVKSKWFLLQNFIGGINKKYFTLLFKYCAMAITTSLTVPVAQMVIRNYIGGNFSWSEAGFWQAITKISDVYLLLITTTLSVYYLPKLAELKDAGQIKKEILSGYKIILPIASILALGIFFCKKEIMYILFTPKFSPMLPLFKFQLLGDVLKIGAWLLGYIMIAKAMTKTYITTEVIFSISYIVFSIIGLRFFGLQGVTMAFALNYLIYWLIMTKIFRTYLKALRQRVRV